MCIRIQLIGLLCVCQMATAAAQEQIIRYYHPLFSPTNAERAGGPRGVIRALVVGIDAYQNAGFPATAYARRDAEAFAAFLKTPAGGALDGPDLVLLTNEQATLARVTDVLQWMTSESQLGDKIIVFFSLGGRLIDRNDARLFFFDAPAVPVDAGYLQLSRLSTLLGNAANRNNARVFAALELRLQEDHAENLANWSGGSYRWGIFNEKISARRPETNPAADSTGAQSTLGTTLLRGLLGQADSNGDEKVYLPELLSYLRVLQETALLRTNAGFLAFSDKQDWVCTYSSPTRERLDRQDAASAATPILQLEVQPLDKFVADHADLLTRRLYEDFILSIRLGQLLPPPERCAAALLDSLLHIQVLEPVHRQLQRRMAVAYQDEAQQAINAYLQTSAAELLRRRKDRELYNRYATYMQQTQDILGADHFMAPYLQIKQLYFEALALRLSYGKTKADTSLLPQAMRKLRQAIVIEPEAAFLYNEMGVVSYLLKQDSTAENYFKLALERSPTWSIPQANRSYIVFKQGDLDEAEELCRIAVSMSSWSPQPYSILGEIYIEKQDYPVAADMFRRALQIDPEYPDAHFNLARMYALQKNTDRALQALEQALKSGFDEKERLLDDPALASIRNTARFKELKEKDFR